MCFMVSFHSVKEFLTAPRVPDMFNTEVDSLLYEAVPNNLVNNHTDRGWRYVVNDAGPSERNTGQRRGLMKSRKIEPTRDRTCGAFPFAEQHWP